MGNLHPDVIVEILLRLPVKSLCRFKCVCKLWNFLISAPKFTGRHVNLAIIDKDIEHQRRKLILILNSSSLSSLYWRKLILISSSLSSLYCVEYEAMASNDVMAVKLDFPVIRSSLDKVKIIGSFNGLLCIFVEPQRMFLFNPAIKELKKIPNLNVDIGRPLYSIIQRPCIYGFGYDHYLGDYKVVKILYESFVYVYSLKTDTWCRAQGFSYSSSKGDPSPGVPLNGAVHWVFVPGKLSIESRPRVIVAFDFAEVKFREVPLPIDAADNFAALGVLGGCLCWLNPCIDTAAKQYDFWVMKEYGVKESWSKVVISIPCLCLRPLGFLKNGEALLEIDGKLVLYNPREATHRELVIHGIPSRMNLEIETYVESLVSPTLWQWE